MRVDVYCPNWSHGLRVCSDVILAATQRIFGRSEQHRILMVSGEYYIPGADVLAAYPDIGREIGDVAIFVERVFNSPRLADYKRRILVPNPEWLDPYSVNATREVIDTVAHKSQFSLATLSGIFPSATHKYIGFTSPDPGRTVSDYQLFAHFRGRSITRHTQSIIDIWSRDQALPDIRVHAYGPDVALSTNGWLSSGNRHVMFGKYEKNEDYFSDLSKCGVHICTSQVEGFGHYINEARAMSALIIVLDAPPVNELVNEECGVLVRTSSEVRMHLGTRFLSNSADLEHAIQRTLDLSVAERKARGREARRAYETGRAAFHDAFEDLLS